AFTPNGDDINEVFVPVLNVAASAEAYTFMIFDRWGLLLFSTEQAGQGWDGTYGGQPVPNDVYVWKVRCHDRVTGKDRDLIGHVTVIR
ncbi:MAG TPA: T9SS type B sorting domain-containing protein, partial [Flavobacteriales bacterium]|nr:T9SS type B sorting domain-containing protein [Flavobacteriales bacterium]